MSNLNGKRFKALAATIPDDASIDLILQDANGGGVDAPDITLGSEMGTNTALVVQLPTGYFLTTTNPSAIEKLTAIAERIHCPDTTGGQVAAGIKADLLKVVADLKTGS